MLYNSLLVSITFKINYSFNYVMCWNGLKTTLLFWYHITSKGGTGLNLETHVKLIVDPQSTCISGPPKISVCGSANKNEN